MVSRGGSPIYRIFFRFLVASGVDGERAHAFAGMALRVTMAIPGVRTLTARLLCPRDPCLRVRAMGIDFPSPLGLGAGVDSNASWFAGVGALGFGFVEVGTVTALAQPGNDGPRVFRLVAERAILNRRGFPNNGASAAAERLRAHRAPGTQGARGGRARSPVVGVNVGKSKAAPLEQAGDDYRASVRRLAALGDYLALNVSSPNTPGLREMQSVERLRELIAEVRDELERAQARVPLLVKIAPDMSDEHVDAIADLALEVKLDGIIAVNTTVDRGVLRVPEALPKGVPDGGISGPPLAPRALAVLRRLRARVGDRVTLISVGGIETPEDAWQRIAAGATLVQGHTAFVYGGPLWPSRINRGLSRLVRASGHASIEAAIGSEGPAGVRPGSEAPLTSARTCWRAR
ncbi:MAG TPA: quinone-dependent dihydroorotate dehydrogenase [Solirubrobacteraceae bacterium]|jgi:dihydroorotate dehydrogenase|nr:quinone-dependent dihydroorotate dehydrogenase [Solirubrobacteraceae bacterium]